MNTNLTKRSPKQNCLQFSPNPLKLWPWEERLVCASDEKEKHIYSVPIELK